MVNVRQQSYTTARSPTTHDIATLSYLASITLIFRLSWEGAVAPQEDWCNEVYSPISTMPCGFRMHCEGMDKG